MKEKIIEKILKKYYNKNMLNMYSNIITLFYNNVNSL